MFFYPIPLFSPSLCPHPLLYLFPPYSIPFTSFREQCMKSLFVSLLFCSYKFFSLHLLSAASATLSPLISQPFSSPRRLPCELFFLLFSPRLSFLHKSRIFLFGFKELVYTVCKHLHFISLLPATKPTTSTAASITFPPQWEAATWTSGSPAWKHLTPQILQKICLRESKSGLLHWNDTALNSQRLKKTWYTHYPLSFQTQRIKRLSLQRGPQDVTKDKGGGGTQNQTKTHLYLQQTLFSKQPLEFWPIVLCSAQQSIQQVVSIFRTSGNVLL